MAIKLKQQHKQRIAVASILLAGLFGSAAVFMPERAKSGAGTSSPSDEADRAQSDRRGRSPEGAEAKPQGNGDGGGPAAGEKESRPHVSKARDEGHEAGKKDHDEREVALTAQQQEASGVTVRAAAASILQSVVRFPGEIRFNDDRTAHVVPRLAGVAESVPARLGQVVSQGQVLATVASTSLSDQRSELLTARARRDLASASFRREKKLWEQGITAEQDFQQAKSALMEAELATQNALQKLAAVGATEVGKGGLNQFQVRAPFAGTIVEKHLSVGEAVKDDTHVFTVSDLSSVWAEFSFAAKDLEAVRVGQKVVVSSTASESKAEGTVSHVGAMLGEQTRTGRARVTLANPKGAWRPGLFVTVGVLGEREQVPLAVPVEAVQTIEEQPMVFVASRDGFSAKPVKLGRSDGTTVEIVGGLQAGDKYAATNTFVLKAELGKAGAEHGH